MTVRVHGGKTEIIGPIIESSHLHGLLERIASLGLRLHSLAPLEAENTEFTRPTHARAHTHHTQPAAVNDRRVPPGAHRSLLWFQELAVPEDVSS